MGDSNLNLHKRIRRFRFILSAIGFGVFYWILESIRDVISFQKGRFIERLLFPDLFSFWMRIMVIFILILSGIYIQSVVKTKEERGEEEKRGSEISMIWVGLAFSLLYWILEGVRDVFVLGKGPLIKGLISPDPMGFWMRLLAVGVLILFSLYTQNIINERKKAEENLQKINKKLKELDQMKSNFISMVSHELRNPIGIMREGVSVCLEERIGKLNEMQKKLLLRTRNNIDRLTRLVTDLLDISRIEAGKLKIRRTNVDIATIAETIIEEYENIATKKGVRLNLSLHDRPIRIYGDGDKITQIFNNLLSNAIRYVENGDEIRIDIRNNEKFIKCSVSDTGKGIAEEHLPYIFSKFEQFGRERGASGYRGTGLGLAITKGLIEKMGGNIWVDSTLGKGTTFHFTLEKKPFPKILIVDDSESIVDVVSGFLRSEGYRVDAAYDGESGVRKAKNDDFSLIILDMMMPEMSGYEVIGRLKHDKRTNNIPILIMSAYEVNRELLNHVDENTAFPQIHKPIDPEELKEKVIETING